MTELTKTKSNQLKINLAQKIESLIEDDNAYGSNIELLSFKLTDNIIAGKFRDTWNRRVFAYSIVKNRLGYRPAINIKTDDTVEQVSKKIDSFSLGYNAIFVAARLDSAKQKKPRCTSISFSCGRICLDINKTCWTDRKPQSAGTTRNNFNDYNNQINEIKTLAKNLQKQNQNSWAKDANNNLSKAQISKIKKGKTIKSFSTLAIKSVGAELDEMFKTGYSELTRYRVREALLGLKKELTGKEIVEYFSQINLLAKEKVQNLSEERESIESQAKIIEQKEGYGEADIFRSNNWNNDLEKLTDDTNKCLNEIGRQFLRVKSPSKLQINNVGITKPNPVRHGIPIRIGDIDPKSLRTIMNGVEIFKEMVGVETLDNKIVDVAGLDPSSKEGGRSFFDNSSINMAKNAPIETTIHELAHWLEESDPIIHKKIQDFFEKRTAGETWQSLRVLTGNPLYGDTEVAKPDKWLIPYMGKKAGWRNSEILSMGMEMMYKAPVDFAKADPEYFAFIYDTLRGK
jgi:hypothetical protein